MRNIIPATRLRAGDILEPDGSKILAAEDDGTGIVITLKQPARGPATYWLPRGWLLEKREGER